MSQNFSTTLTQYLVRDPKYTRLYLKILNTKIIWIEAGVSITVFHFHNDPRAKIVFLLFNSVGNNTDYRKHGPG